jgi:hypothetical protein
MNLKKWLQKFKLFFLQNFVLKNQLLNTKVLEQKVKHVKESLPNFKSFYKILF